MSDPFGAPSALEPSADADLAARARKVRTRVAAAAAQSSRSSSDVLIVAATKTVPPSVLRSVFALGFTTFGENRVQEARDKRAALADLPVHWEMIGSLQTNKVVRAIELFERIQSVDSLHLAAELDRRAGQRGLMLPVLLEVNVASETSKSGFAVDELPAAAQQLMALPHLLPQGLMTIAPLVEHAEEVRPVFRRLRELAGELRERAPVGPDGGWRELSMGMSDDFEVAIEEGATIVRIGRALFGERPQP